MTALSFSFLFYLFLEFTFIFTRHFAWHVYMGVIIDLSFIFKCMFLLKLKCIQSNQLDPEESKNKNKV